ncbi:GNAT family N-acetyltransferase [Actinocatenispora thailandica]|uniref:GNAT family N-acetyltransferase n=1 Tax=Actinocatenispora thailandica TaxID=227318 RepID=UPI0031D2BB4D
MTDSDTLLGELETFYDAVPRDRCRVEHIAGFDLFVRKDTPGHPFYARPALGAPAGTAEDVAAVRARQRELGVPEAFEWVDETTPGLIEPARAAGLAVQLAPLMVLTADDPAPARTPAGAQLRLLDPDSEGFAVDLAASAAVADLAFADGGTAVGAAGPAERDERSEALGDAQVAAEAELIRTGRHIRALAESPQGLEGAEALRGVVAAGSAQRVGPVAEVVGVATLPVARRRGLGLALTGTVVRATRAAGVRVVFLSADNEDVAALYARLGFTRIGTSCIAEPA